MLSNDESGFDRFDLIIIPKAENFKAILIEFQQTEKEEKMVEITKEALKQTIRMPYHSKLLDFKIVKEVIQCGIVFSGKKVPCAFNS